MDVPTTISFYTCVHLGEINKKVTVYSIQHKKY